MDEHLQVGAFADLRNNAKGVGKSFHIGQAEAGAETEAADLVGRGRITVYHCHCDVLYSLSLVYCFDRDEMRHNADCYRAPMGIGADIHFGFEGYDRCTPDYVLGKIAFPEEDLYLA